MNSVNKKEVNMNDDMLVKYLTGEAGTQEIATVQQWLKDSAANRKYYYELKLIWNLSAGTSPTSQANEDEAWQRFQQRVQNSRKKPQPAARPYFMLKAAAILLLMAAAGWLAYNGIVRKPHTDVAVQPAKSTIPVIAHSMVVDTNHSAPVAQNIMVPEPAVNRNSSVHIKNTIAKSSKKVVAAKGYICNSTPCPIEICINQTMKCPNNKPAAISTYSTLEPDQQVQVSYKAHENIAKNCSLTIKDIEIKSIATGEMIILNEHSSPSTAQELFSYITGQKKGDILAGNFHSDCNNNTGEHHLVFDSRAGNWVMQQ